MYIIHNINTKDGGKRGVKNALLEEEKKTGNPYILHFSL